MGGLFQIIFMRNVAICIVHCSEFLGTNYLDGLRYFTLPVSLFCTKSVACFGYISIKKYQSPISLGNQLILTRAVVVHVQNFIISATKW